MASGQPLVCFLREADSIQASEDIGRVAAGVLRVSLISQKKKEKCRLIKKQQHDKYLHRELAITSEAATMDQISESYQRATGRPIPAVPALAGKALVKFNAALQNVYVSRTVLELM